MGGDRARGSTNAPVLVSAFLVPAHHGARGEMRVGPGEGRRRQERGRHSRRRGVTGGPQGQPQWLGRGEDWTGGRAGSEFHLSRARGGPLVRVLGQGGHGLAGGGGDRGDQVAPEGSELCAGPLSDGSEWPLPEHRRPAGPGPAPGVSRVVSVLCRDLSQGPSTSSWVS